MLQKESIMPPRRSWKTTWSAVIGACGAALLVAYNDGYLSVDELPKWAKLVFELMAVLGTAATGVFARDNNVTSDEAGASASKAKLETAFINKVIAQHPTPSTAPVPPKP